MFPELSTRRGDYHTRLLRPAHSFRAGRNRAAGPAHARPRTTGARVLLGAQSLDGVVGGRAGSDASDPTSMKRNPRSAYSRAGRVREEPESVEVGTLVREVMDLLDVSEADLAVVEDES